MVPDESENFWLQKNIQISLGGEIKHVLGRLEIEDMGTGGSGEEGQELIC